MCMWFSSDNVGIDLEIAFLLAEAQGIQDDLHGGWAREDGYPVQDCAGQEVRYRFVVDFVAAASHWADSRGLFGYGSRIGGAGAPL
uniref:Uncharacterized protein n=1 Tax=Candidatus Kentrum sp. FW TaxID=2126338 RepID=A0A450U4D0_9GAMM|nr:MAG: hypothetical protein BECKFW1821C_GA0114237_11817 [Candidatus Kentron sp. FW]